MAGLLNWLGDKAKRLEAQVNPFDGGASWNNPNPQQPARPAAAPAQAAPPQLSASQKVAKFLNGIPNVHLDGLTQLRDEFSGKRYDDANTVAGGGTPSPSNPVTIGDVAHHTPILKQAIDFAHQQAVNPPTSLMQGEGQLLSGIGKTGAHYAPYAVPEIKVLDAGPGVAAKVLEKAVNNGVPAAATSAADQLAEGQRDPGEFAKNVALATVGNAAMSELPLIRGLMKDHPTDEMPITLRRPGTQPAPVADIPTAAAPIQPPTIPAKVVVPRPAEPPVVGQVQPPVMATAQGVKERGLTRNIKKNDNFSTELQQTVEGGYTPFTDKEALAGTEDFMKQGLDNAHKQALSHLASDQPIGKQGVSDYGRVLQELDGAGRTDEANTVHDLLAKKLTEAGQTGQAASLLYKRTPEGLRNMALRDLRNAKVEITPELKKEIEGHIAAIKELPDGPLKDFQVAVLQKAVAKHIPTGAAENAVSVWKAGLLSGAKTQGGNFASNATFGGLHKISDLPSAVADKVMSYGSGERKKTFSLRGIGSGTKEGLGNAKTTMKTGIDMRNVGDKYEQHGEINFGNKILQNVLGKPANLVFRGMSAADQPFYYSALKNSLYDQAKAAGVNKSLKGAELRKFMDDLVQNPTEKMAETASKEANKAVLGYDTFASKGISAVHRGIDKMPGASNAGKQIAHAAVNILAPFTKVPSAFLSRTVDFTPLGVGKEVFSQIAHKEFDQRALATAIGEGITGTGVIALGIALAHQNMLSGDYPTDPKEQARWKAEGITQNSVKLGGKWVSLNYLGPVGLLFNAGHKMVGAEQGGAGAPAQAASALAGLGQGLMGQSFLQGFSGFSDAIKDPERNAASFVRSEVGSIIPSWSNDVANATDPMQRQVNSATDAIKQRIPGARESLNVKKDSFGNPLEQAAGSGLETAINPLKPSNDLHTPLLTELDRLKGTGKDNFVFPTTDKTLSVGNETIKMNADQQDKYNTATGQQTQALWNDIIKSPEYASLDDTQKANALRTAAADISAINKKSILSEMGKGDLSDKVKLTARQDSLSAGTTQADSYIANAGGKQTPQDAYKEKLAQYNADKKAGKLSAFDDFKAQQDLSKMAITSKFSQDVQDLYGMSKNARNAFLASNPQSGALMDQVAQLSAELKNKNFTSTDKIASASKAKRPKSLSGTVLKASSSSKAARAATVKAPKSSNTKTAKAKVKAAGKVKLSKITTRKQLA